MWTAGRSEMLLITGKRGFRICVWHRNSHGFAFALGDYRFLHCVKQFGLLREGEILFIAGRGTPTPEGANVAQICNV